MKKAYKIALLTVVTGVCLYLAVCVFAGRSLAFLSDRDEAVNPLFAGDTEIEIAETFLPPETPPPPGEAITKTVRVLNTGELTCLIRARLLFEDDLIENLVEPFEPGTDWYCCDDGFYYYLKPVAPGETTAPLIEELRYRTVSTDGVPVTRELIEAAGTGLIVYSEALEHTAHESNCKTEEILDAWSLY